MEAIYSLANYENSGYLLEQCRELLCRKSGPKSASTVSGYHTQETSCNRSGLHWLQLIEEKSWGACGQLDDCYEGPVLRLCAKLEAAIR